MTPRGAQAWPDLPLSAWADTYHTLHMWLQMVGKIRLTLTPKENHWWNAALYLTARGLTTSPMPYQGGAFEIQVDFVDHRVSILTSRGPGGSLKLAPRSVSAFYRELMAALAAQGITVLINLKPQEVADPIPFDQDETHASYDPEYAHRCWRILLSAKLVLDQFRSRFTGKVSPVHFFWGSFDLACTRFSGRRAPARKGVITGEAYSHECSSAGWWPGGGPLDGPAFYAYAAPEPPGFAEHGIRPEPAFYHPELHEFILKYDDARRAPSPAAGILTFFQSAYEAGATLGGWDRAALERE
jgi:Family of unknown function (DUF5996)